MSTKIDQNVVEMQFDNHHFETHVRETMSTLDKLKDKLKFTGASKGVEAIGVAVDATKLKFRDMYTAADQYLVRLRDKAFDTGERLAKSLSIDQITAGWNKYTEKTGSVQTIMNATGKSIEEVNGYLEELMWFSDETSYGFNDMISGLATMVSTGGDIEKLIPLITGVANATAFAGKGAAEFSRVLQYGVNQAYSLGYMQVQDWKTLESATVNSKQLMESLIRAGEELGKIKKGQVTLENFRSTLQDKWLDTSVMEKGFGKFSELSQAAYDLVNSGEFDTASEAMEHLAGKYDEIAEKAFKSAQEAKSFTEAVEATKDAVSSGWMKTFEIIFGDYNEAKVLWTDVANTLWDVFASGAETRNNILEKALGSKWDNFVKQVEGAGLSFDDFQETLAEVAYESGKSIDEIIEKHGSLENAFRSGAISTDLLVTTLGKYADMEYDVNKSTSKMTEKLDYFQKVFNEVWSGNWGNGQERYDRLTAAGYKYAEVQDLINNYEIGHKFTLEELSDAQLISIGYTEDQIAAIRELGTSAQNTDTPIRKLIDSLTSSNGRELLIESFKNIGKAIGSVLDPIKESWNRIYPSEDEAASGLYGLIEAFHDLTSEMAISDETAARLGNIFDNVFKSSYITTTIFTKSLKSGLTLLDAVLKLFGTDILGLAEYIAELIGKFAEWLDAHTMMVNPTKKLAKLIRVVVEGVHGMIEAFLGLEGVQKIAITIANMLGGAFKELGEGLNLITFDEAIAGLKTFFDGMTEAIKAWDGSAAFNAGIDFMYGLLLGIKGGIDGVLNTIFNIGWAMIKAIMDSLDEHSPSKKTEEVGENFMVGLQMGLEKYMPKLFETLKRIGSKLMEMLIGLDLSDIFVMGSVAAMGMFAKRMVDIIDKIVNPLSTLNEVFKEFKGSGDAFKGMFSSIGKAFMTLGADISNMTRKHLNSKSLLNIAKAIGILAVAVALLAYVGSKNAWALVGAVAVIVTITGALVVLMNTINKIDGNIGDFAKIGFLVGTVAAAILMVAIAMRTINNLGLEGAISSIVAVTAIIGMMGGLIWAFGTFTNRFTSKNLAQAGLMFIGLAVTVGIIARAMKVFGTLSTSDVIKSTVAIAAITGFITAALFAFSKIDNGANPKMMKQAGKTFTRMSIAIGILAVAMKVIATMSWSDIIKGIAVISAVELLFIGIVAVSKKAQYAKEAGQMFWRMGVAIGILAVAMKVIATMSLGDITKGLFVVGALETMFVLFTRYVKIVGNDMDAAGSLFWKMGAALALLAVAMKIIAGISVSDLAKGVIVVSVLEFVIAQIIKVSKDAGVWASEAGTMLMKMSLAILILVGAIALLSILDPKDVAVGTAAVSALIFMFSLITKSLNGANDIAATITKIAIALAILVGAIALLALLDDPTGVATAAASIAAVVGAFAILMAATKFAKNTKSMMRTILVLTAIVGVIAGLLALMSFLPTQPALETAAAISLVLLAMAGSMAIIGTIGRVSKSAQTTLLYMLGAVAGVAAILGILAWLDVKPSIETATALSILLLAMSGVCAIMAAIGPTATLAAQGALAFDAVVLIIGGLVIALGALMQDTISIEPLLDKGILAMEKIGTAVGALFGGVIAGAISSGSKGFVDLAESLKEYGEVMKDVDVASISASAEAVRALVEVAKLIPNSGGLVSLFTGDNDLADFAYKLIPFGIGLRNYATAVSGITPDQITAITSSAEAAKAIVGVVEAIPTSGGLAALFTGDNDMASFALKLVPFGLALKSYALIASEISEDDIAAIVRSMDATKAIVDVANAVPDTGGMKVWVSGDNDIATFAEKLVPFGTNLKLYADAVADITPESITAIKNSTDAVKAIVDIANVVPNTGGMKAWISGDNDLTTFGFQMTRLAQGIVEYNRTISGGLDIEAIKNSTKAVTEVVKLAEAIPTTGGLENLINGNVDYAGFGAGIVPIGRGVKEYSAVVTGLEVEPINKSITVTEKLVKMINKMSDIDTSGVNSFRKAIKSLSELSMDDFTAGFTMKETDIADTVIDIMTKAADAIKKTEKAFKTKGEETVGWTKDGINKNADVASDATEDVSEDMVEAAESYYDEFEIAGGYLVEGFASGINQYTYMAEAQARAMAAAAARAAEQELQINSPSRVFEKIGAFVPAGFARGIGKLGSLVSGSAVGMADSAIDTVRKSISRLSNLVTNDIDTQPTIRPVLDLSEVSSGASEINGMLDMNPSIGVLRNVGVINSMMNRNQNGGNSDVISAIKDLGRSLGNSSNNTYNINGVTYDDGTNVSDAVKALVRAARIERRV